MYVWALNNLQSYKSQSPLQREIFRFKKNPFSRTTTNGLIWTTKLFSCICDIKKINPAHGNSKMVWRGGEKTLSWVLHVSNQKPRGGCFYITVLIGGNQLFSEYFGCHFHFILHIMSDKAVLWWEELCFCIQQLPGNLDLYTPTASRWQRINLHITVYAATNSVSLWDYGIINSTV